VETLAVFLEGVFRQGRIVVEEPPAGETAEDSKALAVCRRAFDEFRLEVAGPVLDLDSDIALASARFLYTAAWFLFHFEKPEQEVATDLAFPKKPGSAGQHLSADLVFRYLPAILGRARALPTGDVLADIISEVLRHWPLSGVLADLPEGPTGALDFFGHPGLQLLYAERLAQHFKPAWVPEEQYRAHVELVWSELGKDSRLLITPTVVSGE
jgi:hypothetical protein